MTLTFHNTMTRDKEPFEPIQPGRVGIYTCGPTVYNFAHIGNFRAYIFEDLLRKTLKIHGLKVTQVMNLTDVDDKTIRGARKANSPLKKHTQQFVDAFFHDLDTLRVERAEVYPAATDHVPDMIELIQTLVNKGFAYQSEDKSVYFSIAKFPQYGKLARVDMRNQRQGERVKNDEYDKEAVADFALWKAWDENDGDVRWDSPWGPGRPGWHVECSAMSAKYLGKSFDIHTGGIDNMFPHHEDEIAQSEAAHGVRYVKYWMHCEYLVVDGKKMSKSLGNFHTIRDLLDKGVRPEDIRWTLLTTHYRKKLNFTLQECERARDILKGFQSFFARLREVRDSGKIGENPAAACQKRADFKNALGDDLNISEALAAVFGLERESNRLLARDELGAKGASNILDAFRVFDSALSVFDIDQEREVPPEIQNLVDQRQQARTSRDYDRADQIRDQISQMGWTVEDTPAGPRVERG